MQEPAGASTNKFQGEQDSRHSGRLYWPGYHGLPFRGNSPPILHRQEMSKLHFAADAHFGTFDLSNERDAEYYNWMRDRVRNGWFTQDYIERHWNEEKQTMVIYCEWTQNYAQLSPSSYTG